MILCFEMLGSRPECLWWLNNVEDIFPCIITRARRVAQERKKTNFPSARDFGKKENYSGGQFASILVNNWTVEMFLRFAEKEKHKLHHRYGL